MTEMSVADIVRLNALSCENSTALVTEPETRTYGQLQADIERVAAALNVSGVRKGDRVATLGKNSYAYVLLYFALARIGALIVPLSYWQRGPEVIYALSDAGPRMLFVEPEMRGLVDSGVNDLAFSLDLIELPGENGDHAQWEAFLSRGDGQSSPAPEIDPGDPHMILYTSGTTGRPKGAVLSHGRTVNDALASAVHLGARQSDVFLEFYPPFHVGNWDQIKVFLLVGATVVLQRAFNAGEVLSAIAVHRPTVLVAVPAMFHSLLAHPDRSEADLSCFRLIFYGGANDPSDIMTEVAEAFKGQDGRAKLAHQYGLTEAGPIVCYCPPEDLLAHWGSVGKPITGVEVALLNDRFEKVALGEPGEICVRGPHMSGYWQKPEETQEAFAGDWLHTGDVAVRDRDGFLTIVDRKKDVIRSGGQNIYSKEVEDCLSTHERVSEVAIVGLPDAVFEELVCAVVVPTKLDDADEQFAAELIRFVRENMAGYNSPRRVEFVSELPKNAVGKTQKDILRGRFASATGGVAR